MYIFTIGNICMAKEIYYTIKCELNEKWNFILKSGIQ